jgi:hypothetical protein
MGFSWIVIVPWTLMLLTVFHIISLIVPVPTSVLGLGFFGIF